MLNRLPDVLTLARQRARELWTCPVGARIGRRQAPLPTARLAPVSEVGYPVSLLCGDDFSVLSGLLCGQADDGPLVGRVAMIWIAQADGPEADETPTHPTQRHVRQLIELTTRLYLARELLVDRGSLVVMAQTDPDRCAQRLQEAVFGHCRVVTPRGGPHTGVGAHISGRAVLKWPTGATGASLLGDWVRHGSTGRDRVLVLGAPPTAAPWITTLDRRWVLSQRHSLPFHRLREHILARQQVQTGLRLTGESHREWAAAPVVHPRTAASQRT